jgi:hypothetical protein
MHYATLDTDEFSAAILPPQPGESAENLVQRHVRLALSCSQPARKVTERRRETRHPYPYPIYLTPLSPRETPLVDATLVVIGKHLSDHGVDFYHREPIPYGRLICSLGVGDQRWVSLLLELTWCRFSKHGWYDNGGKFLQSVATPPGLRRR